MHATVATHVQGDVNIRSKNDQTLVGASVKAENISLVSETGNVRLIEAREEVNVKSGGLQFGMTAVGVHSNAGEGSARSSDAGALEMGFSSKSTGTATRLTAKNDVSVSAGKDIVNRGAKISDDNYVVSGNEVKSAIVNESSNFSLALGGDMHTVTSVPAISRPGEGSVYTSGAHGDMIFNRKETKDIDRVVLPSLLDLPDIQGARAGKIEPAERTTVRQLTHQ